MAIPTLKLVANVQGRDLTSLDTSNFNIAGPQVGRHMYIIVSGVTTININQIANTLTVNGGSLAGGEIIQIGVDMIATFERQAFVGVYHVENANIGGSSDRVQVSFTDEIRQPQLQVIEVLGSAEGAPHAFRQVINEDGVDADVTVGTNLTTTVDNCVVFDVWSFNTLQQPVASAFQTPLFNEPHSRGVSVSTQLDFPAPGVATFTQRIDEATLVLALTTIALQELSNPPTNVSANGPYTGDVGTAINIDGTFTLGSDPTPTLLWTIVSGGTGTFGNAANASTTFTPDVVGDYTLRFSVLDSDSLGGTADALLTSDPVPPTDVLAGGPYVSEVGVPTAISGTFVAGTDPAPTLSWTIVSGGTGTFGDATAANTTFAANSIGPYVLRFTVNPLQGVDVQAQANFDSQAIPPKNVNAGGPYNGEVNIPTQLSASVDLGTDANPAYSWRIVSGGTGTFSNITLLSPTFNAHVVGPYVLELSVDPNTGPAVLDTATFESTDTPPSDVNAGGPYIDVVGTPVQLNAFFTPGTIAAPTLLWTIVSGGAGTFSDNAITNPTFTPDVVGPYVLRFSVDDGVTPTLTSDADLDSVFVIPPSNVDAGGPYDATVIEVLPIAGTFDVGSDPNPGILWTQTDGPAGIFGDPTALATTFLLNVLGIATLRLTITPAIGPAIFAEDIFSSADCQSPQISLNTVTHLAPDTFIQFDEPMIPDYQDGDISILRLRIFLYTDTPDTELTLVGRIGTGHRLYLTADLTEFRVTNSVGVDLGSLVLSGVLPRDVQFLFGIRMTHVNVATGEHTYQIFNNNISQGTLTVTDLDAASNDMGTLFTGRDGIEYMSIQFHYLLAALPNDLIITMPVFEGQGPNLKAFGTNCIEYDAQILTPPFNIATQGLHFTWNISDGQQINDSMLRTLESQLNQTMIQDGLIGYYQLHGATSSNVLDAEKEFLAAQGIADTTTQDMWAEFLSTIPSLPLKGTVRDMKAQWWAVGAPVR